MKARKTIVTVRQLEQLAGILRTTLSQPFTPCLRDEEFVEYSMALRPQDDTRRIQDHLASCEECTEEMRRLVEEARAWEGKPGEQRLAALRQRMENQGILVTPPSPGETKLSIATLRDGLRHFLEAFSYSVAFAPSSHGGISRPDERESADGTFTLFIKEDKARNVLIRVAVVTPELEETVKIRLSAGEWHEEVALARFDAYQIGAEVMIPYEERKKFPEGTTLFATVI